MTRHPCGRRDHVLLGDAALDEALGVRELERADAAVRGEVGVEDDEIVALTPELEQHLAVGLDHVLVGDLRAGPGPALGLTLETSGELGRLDGIERRWVEAERGAPFRDASLELSLRALERLVAGRPRMPAIRPVPVRERGRVLHERDALALDRARDERLRRALLGAEPHECLAQCGVVVPVDRVHVPAESTQLALEVAQRDDLLGAPVRLHLVAVDDDPQPAEALVRGRLERFPVLALLELAVAGHHDDTASPAQAPLRERDPAALRDPHAERAGAGLDTGHADVRMAVEAPETAEAEQVLTRDDAEGEERRIQPRHVMPLGREEDVSIRVVEPELGDVELLEEHVRDDVERAEGRAEVPGARALDSDERVQATGVGEEGKLAVGLDVGCTEPVELELRDEAEIGHVQQETVADPLAGSMPLGARGGRPSRGG